MKRCISCNEEKPPEEFWRHSSRPSGLNDRCKPCARIIDRKDKQKPERRAKRKDSWLRKLYGTTLEIWKELWEFQSGLCDICKDPLGKTQINLDHCHATRKVRGLLCNRCNILLGNSLDKIEILENAILYLKNHSA